MTKFASSYVATLDGTARNIETSGNLLGASRYFLVHLCLFFLSDQSSIND